MRPLPPTASTKPHSEIRHGRRVSDEYAWLKDPQWQRVLQEPSQLAPDIRAYLDAENAYTAHMLAEQAELEAQLYEELKARLPDDDDSVPLRDGPYAYSQGFRPGQQYQVFRRQLTNGNAPHEDLLQVEQLAAGHAYCHVGAVSHSYDHAKLAYTIDLSGGERYELRVRDLATGRDDSATLLSVGAQFAWSADSLYLFYIVIDEHNRPKEVKRHRLGTAVDCDVVVYREPDDGFFLTIQLASSRRFLLLTAYDHTHSEVHALDMATPLAAFTCVHPRTAGLIYEVTHRASEFVVTLHAPDAKDGRIVATADCAPNLATARELIGYRAGQLVQEVHAFAEYVVRLTLEHALPQIVVHHVASGVEHTLEFSEAAYFLTIIRTHEYASTTLRFTYSSMTTPEQTFDYDMASRQRRLLKQQQVPSGHRPEAYEVVRLHATARDGALVPITLLRHRTTPHEAPLLLYAYGAYGRSMPTSFSPHRFSLVDRGVAYAVAHVRGGKEKGYAWYESALLLNKKNTFYDFIDCAEHLVQSGITRRGGIIGHGASAGGMLIGAVANMTDDLFLGLVADVPFVDVLSTMCDENLPLTPPEWPEWGNPISDPAVYDYITSYSPYDNVTRKPYPHLLVLAGLTDPRVTYWESAKWVAKLRALKTGNERLLLDTNMGAGHAGASGRFAILHKVARIYGFVLTIAKGDKTAGGGLP